jgi:tetratricopeptide (TPR) repeat protein
MDLCDGLIEVTQPGRTIRYAWVPESVAAYKTLIAALRCPACGRNLGQRSSREEQQDLEGILHLRRSCTCRCGFENFWYFIVNLLDPDNPLKTQQQVEAALVALEKGTQLTDPIYEVGIYELAVAAERREIARAIQLAERLIASYRGDATLFFYLGLFYGEANRLGDAMMAYHNARRMQPDMIDAIYNQGIILTRMGRKEEGARFLEVYHDLTNGKEGVEIPNEDQPLAVEEGMFGTICILDSGLYRRMNIETQSQGSAFCMPTSQDFAPEAKPGPGAFPESPYTIGLLIPAALHQNGQGLLLGLGSGIGPTLLLSAFPKLRLTVVEIDPTVVQLARQYFPLVDYYISEGRLDLVLSDAFDYVEDQLKPKAFDFAMLDLYQGDPEQPAGVYDGRFLSKLAEGCCHAIWPNLIGKPQSKYFLHVSEAFSGAGLTIHYLSAGIDQASRNTLERNWLMATESFDIGEAKRLLKLQIEDPAAELDQEWPLYPQLPVNHALRLVRRTVLAYLENNLPMD